MSEPINLKELAENAAKTNIEDRKEENIIDNTENINAEKIEAEVINDIDEDDDDSIIMAPVVEKTTDVFDEIKPVKLELTEEELNEGNSGSVDSPTAFNLLTDAEMRALMPDISDEKFQQILPKIKSNIEKYKKGLIINSGFTPEEANEAALNKMRKDSIEENDKYLQENPKVGVIEIKKEDLENLALTPEEHSKLEKVKVIKLSVVEDEELKSIKLDTKYDAKHKSDYIKSIEGSLSKYSVPLPSYGDYLTFRGAQIIQLASIVMGEDERLEEILNKKASLIYDKILNGKIFKKFDEKGKIIMSYEDFVNVFPYHDINIAIYGILVASSMEETEAELTCNKCNQVFNYKYNVKELLNLSDSPEFSERVNKIINCKSNSFELKNLHDEMTNATRYKSPFTYNIYQISYPTVGRATHIFEKINQNDQVMVYNSLLALYLNAIYIYNPETDGYVQITEDEVDTMLDTILDVADEDYQLIINQVKSMFTYEPRFTIKTVCPHCGEELELNYNIDNLIFFKAQDSLKVIQ
jgi:hypothetical protein